MKLGLEGIEVDCIIGELPDERERLQRLTVDVELEIFDEAASSDELSDTVDYAALSFDIRKALVDGRFKMIERAAKAALDVCMASAKVRAAEVKVSKRGAVAGLKGAFVVLAS